VAPIGGQVKVGRIPQVGPVARPDVIGPLPVPSRRALDSLWVFDHVVLQKEQESKYPYSADGKMGSTQLDFLELLTPLTYLAGITSRVQLGTSVLVAPMRQPVLHAKIPPPWTALQRAVILGAGVGWWKQEFEVLGVPWERRGKRMDECLQLMKALWTEEWVNFKGECYEAVDWTCNPKPVNGTIPVLLGGESRQQLERVGKYADGWLATARSLPTLEGAFQVAKDAAEKGGRDPGALTIAIEGAGFIGSENMGLACEQLAQLAGRGVAHAICTVNPREYAGAVDIIRRFGEEYLRSCAERRSPHARRPTRHATKDARVRAAPRRGRTGPVAVAMGGGAARGGPQLLGGHGAPGRPPTPDAGVGCLARRRALVQHWRRLGEGPEPGRRPALRHQHGARGRGGGG
jgi:probable F420-dependent oxidoreductase